MESQRSAKWRDLGLRSLSAAILIPLVLAAVWTGDAWFTTMVALVGVMVAYEWTNIVHGGSAIQFALHAIAAISGALLATAAGLPATLIVLAIVAAVQIVLLRLEKAPANVWSYLGIPYVGLPTIALVVLRSDVSYGMFAVIWILIVVWASDIAAYFSGRIIGGPRLAPVISPNKTWAGAIGAMIASLFAGALAAYIMVGSLLMPAFLGAVLSVVAQGGDLFKSALKRHYGLKDSGRLIPGHGGIIDRIDGVIAAAVAAAIIGTIRAGPAVAGRGILSW